MAILKSSGGYSFNTETNERTDPTGGINKIENPISIDTLNQQSFKVPETMPQPETQALGSAIDGLLMSESKKYLEAQKLAETDKTGITDLMKVIGSEGQMREDLYQTEGVDVAKQQADEYTSQIEAEALSARRQIEKIQRENLTGALRGGQIDLMNNIQRESLSKQADLAILQSAATRRYDTASQIVERKIAAQLEPLKVELDIRKFLYQENKEQLTKAEDRLWNQAIKEEERTYQKQEEELRENNQMILNAIQGGAPKNLVMKAQELSNTGADRTQIANTLGKYSLSASDRLDLQLKQAQLGKIYADIESMKMSEIEEAQKEIEAQEKEIVKNQEMLPGIQDKITKIDNLLTDKSIAGVVGPTKLLGRMAEPFDILGNKANFIAGVENLISQETLDTLIGLKKEGGTLGALSDKEREMLKNAASKIGFWAIENKKGKVVGYDASEKDFKTELTTLKTLAERAYLNAGGKLPGSEVEREALNDYLDIVDGSLLQTTNLYGAYSNL